MRAARRRHPEHGGLTLEHLGVMVVVVALVAGVVVVAPATGASVADKLSYLMCRVAGLGCGAAGDPGEPGAAGDPGEGDGGEDGDGGNEGDGDGDGDDGGEEDDGGGGGGLFGFVPNPGDIADGFADGVRNRVGGFLEDLGEGAQGFLDRGGDFVEGLASPLTGAWDSAMELIDDPLGWLDARWDNLYNHVAFWNWDTFTDSWKQAGKDFLAWDEWGENPWRAAGTLTVNVATLGIGSLAKRFLLRGRGGGRTDTDANADQGGDGRGDQDGTDGDQDGTEGAPGDIADARRRFRENYPQWEADRAAVEEAVARNPELEGIPIEDLVALRAYTRENPAYYQEINRALRENDADALARYDDQIRATTSGLNQLPPFQGTVYRGIRGLSPEQAANIANNYEPGSTVTERAFTSTAAGDPAFEGRVQFVIESESGRDISQVSHFPDSEREVLFAPGTQFRVLDRQFDPAAGTWEIFLAEP